MPQEEKKVKLQQPQLTNGSSRMIKHWTLAYGWTMNGQILMLAIKLLCKVCKRFQGKIQGSRNFNTVFIDGLPNLRTSCFKDHATTDMHIKEPCVKEQSSAVVEYSPLFRFTSI